MKKTLKYLATAIITLLLAIPSTSFALVPAQPNQGGTGTSIPPTIGQLLVGNSSAKYIATTTFPYASTTAITVSSTGYFGTGSDQNIYGSLEGRTMVIRDGTNASPVVGGGSSVKISRIDSLASTSCSGGNKDDTGCSSALEVTAIGEGSGDMVTNGILAAASTSRPFSGRDAIGITGLGRVTGLGKGVGTGGYLEGYRSTATGYALGVEVSAINKLTTDCPVANTAGLSRCTGLWSASRGNGTDYTVLSAALAVGVGDGNSTWHTGLIFTNGSVASTTIDDSSNSTTSIKITGTHTYAFTSQNTAGNVGIGIGNPTGRLIVRGVGVGTGLTLQTTDSANNPSLTVLDNGTVLFGSGTSYNGTGSFARDFQFYGSNGMQLGRFSNDTFGAGFQFTKSRGTTVGTHTTIVTGDILGQITAAGSDGTNYNSAAQILMLTEGTVSAGVIPGRIEFWTANSAGTLTKGMSMDSSQRVGIGTSTPLATLDVRAIAGVNDAFAVASSTNIKLFSVDAIGNALVTNKVGVGTTTPTATMDIYGVSGANDIFRISSSTNSRLLTLSAAGNLGINNSSPTAKLSVKGAGTGTGLNFQTTDSASTAVITALDNGTVLFGSGTSYNGTGAFARSFQFYTTLGVEQGRYSADANGPGYQFSKSRSATVGTQSVITTGDILGQLSAAGSDGTSLFTGAQILFVSEGTIGTGIIPARIDFQTADSAGTLTIRQTIDSNGHVKYKGTAPTLSSCGTSPSLAGSDTHGTISVGSVSATGCTVTFNKAYTTAPDCVVTNQSMSVVNALTYTISTTTLTISQTGLTSAKVNYICFGN